MFATRTDSLLWIFLMSALVILDDPIDSEKS